MQSKKHLRIKRHVSWTICDNISQGDTWVPRDGRIFKTVSPNGIYPRWLVKNGSTEIWIAAVYMFLVLWVDSIPQHLTPATLNPPLDWIHGLPSFTVGRGRRSHSAQWPCAHLPSPPPEAFCTGSSLWSLREDWVLFQLLPISFFLIMFPSSSRKSITAIRGESRMPQKMRRWEGGGNRNSPLFV